MYKIKANVVTLAYQKDIDNLMNQSELEVNTCSLGQAREYLCERVTSGSGFTLDWIEKMARVSLANRVAW